MNLKSELINVFDLSKEEVEIVYPYFKQINFKKGEFFIQENQPVERMGIIKNGITREYFIDKDQEITKFIATEGDFISDASGLNLSTKSRWNIKAVTECEIYTISKNQLEQIRQKMDRWLLIEKLFTVKCIISAENRILDHLKLNAEERYLKLLKEKPQLFNYVELKHIASFLGIKAETLSRFRNKNRI